MGRCRTVSRRHAFDKPACLDSDCSTHCTCWQCRYCSRLLSLRGWIPSALRIDIRSERLRGICVVNNQKRGGGEERHLRVFRLVELALIGQAVPDFLEV